MLGPISEGESILLAGDLANKTDAAESMDRRLVRLASHYRQRALMAEDALDNVVMAADMPGDHCEMTNAVEFARRVLALVPPHD